MAQPVQPVLFVSAGKNPFLLEHFDITMQPLGQNTTHKPQPLHRSVSIIILPAIFALYISQPISEQFHKLEIHIPSPGILTKIIIDVKDKNLI